MLALQATSKLQDQNNLFKDSHYNVYTRDYPPPDDHGKEGPKAGELHSEFTEAQSNLAAIRTSSLASASSAQFEDAESQGSFISAAAVRQPVRSLSLSAHECADVSALLFKIQALRASSTVVSFIASVCAILPRSSRTSCAGATLVRGPS